MRAVHGGERETAELGHDVAVPKHPAAAPLTVGLQLKAERRGSGSRRD